MWSIKEELELSEELSEVGGSRASVLRKREVTKGHV